MLDSNIVVILIVVIVINTFFTGYFLGRFANHNGVSNDRPKSFFKQQDSKQQQEVSSIAIDDKKFVVDIKTEGLEKKYNSLGDVKTTEENISESVNKLKNMKR